MADAGTVSTGWSLPRSSGDARVGQVPLWAGFLVLAGLGVLAFCLTGSEPRREVIYAATGLFSSGAVVLGTRLHRPELRLPWYLVAVGHVLWVCGGLLATSARRLDETRLELVSQVLVLSAFPLVAAALYLMLQRRRTHWNFSGVLGATTAVASLSLPVWVFVMQPAMAAATTTLQMVEAVAYPVGDVLLVGGLAHLMSTMTHRVPATRILVASALLHVAAGAVRAMDDASGPTQLTLALALLSYVGWGLAALHPSMTALSRPGGPSGPTYRRLRPGGLIIAFLVAPVVLLLQSLNGGPRGEVGPAVIGSIVLFLLVVARMWVAFREVVALKESQEQLQDELAHQARHDPLTGLPNRAQLGELVQEAVDRSRDRGRGTAVLFIDLDGFKAINDTHGHRSGDAVLVSVAQRLLSAVRSGDTAVRIGGDEFVVVLGAVDGVDEAVAVARRVVDSVARPIELADGVLVSVGASVGVATMTPALTQAEELLHEADLAVYRAKANGRGRVEVAGRPEGGDPLAGPEATEAALRRAVVDGELVCHYQPLLALTPLGGSDPAGGDPTAAVVGFEALVRWERPGVGLVMPGDFVPLAEGSDLICDIDAWVMTEALMQLARWRAGGEHLDVAVAVNVSARHLHLGRVVDDVVDALAASGLTGAALVVEVTETLLVDDDVAAQHLQALRRMGVRISLDDFGAGHNSVTRLARLPVDAVKLDRRWVTATTPEDTAVLDVLVHAARRLGVEVVVGEGVEEAEQLERLRRLGCDQAQGYLLGRPTPAAAASVETCSGRDGG